MTKALRFNKNKRLLLSGFPGLEQEYDHRMLCPGTNISCLFSVHNISIDCCMPKITKQNP